MAYLTTSLNNKRALVPSVVPSAIIVHCRLQLPFHRAPVPRAGHLFLRLHMPPFLILPQRGKLSKEIAVSQPITPLARVPEPLLKGG